jgi:hypothetical protein|eukprot:COSAG06_NODE_31_length_31488_cov_60.882793_33_plen_58_part_00
MVAIGLAAFADFLHDWIELGLKHCVIGILQAIHRVPQSRAEDQTQPSSTTIHGVKHK